MLGLSTGPGVDYSLLLPLCALIAMSFFHGLMQTPVFKSPQLPTGSASRPSTRQNSISDRPTECVQQQQEPDLILSPIQRFIPSEDVESRIY